MAVEAISAQGEVLADLEEERRPHRANRSYITQGLIKRTAAYPTDCKNLRASVYEHYHIRERAEKGLVNGDLKMTRAKSVMAKKPRGPTVRVPADRQ